MIILGDALTELRKMPDAVVDAVVTDPPFGIGFYYGDGREKITNSLEYGLFIDTIFTEVKRVLRVGGFFAIWQAAPYFKNFWDWFGDDIHIYAGCKNWVQLRKTPINYGFDPIVMGYTGKPELRPDKPARNIDFFVANTARLIQDKTSLAKQHPCPRPIDQVEEIIRNFTLPDGVVLDPFFGSGTTGVACIKHGRDFIGIELNPEYVALAHKRLQEVQMVMA